jgi:hypothetical protein
MQRVTNSWNGLKKDKVLEKYRRESRVGSYFFLAGLWSLKNFLVSGQLVERAVVTRPTVPNTDS